MLRLRRYLSIVYGGVTLLRNYLFDRGLLPIYRSPLPVVSVGNVTAGGNGKTPVVMVLVEALAQRGYRPVILSRGYGGRVRGPLVVDPTHSARDVGDEPLLLARRSFAPVIIARDRVRGIKEIERRQLGDVVVLDDGFQHRRLGRSVDIVCINVAGSDGVDDFMRGEMLPLGRFREDREYALMRADIVVIAERAPLVGKAGLSTTLLSLLPKHVAVFRSVVVPLGVFDLASGRQISPSRVVVFCGVANPAGVRATVENLGFSVEALEVFPDHHPFSEGDIVNLRGRYPHISLVCTEKDEVKIPEGVRDGIGVIRISTEVIPADAFEVQVLRGLRRVQKVASRSLRESNDEGHEPNGGEEKIS